MQQNKILPALVCGFGAAALSTIPGFKGFACCLFVPLAAALSLVLHRKINKAEIPFKTGTGLFYGFLTGIFIAVFATSFEIIITLITHTNDFVESLPQTEEMMKDLNLGALYEESIKMLKTMANEIRLYGFSLLYTIGIFFSNLVIDSFFGMIGGLLGLLFVNRRT